MGRIGRVEPYRNDEWAIITARLDYKFHRAYGRKGPVFTVQSVQEVEKRMNAEEQQLKLF